VASCTANFALPFQECSDSPCGDPRSPCDFSTIWCDFVGLVEDQIVLADSAVARTATAIPLAVIHYEPAVAVAIADTIPFDTVLADTDNMVDLTIFPGITPSRNGRYLIDLYVRFGCCWVDNEGLTTYIRVGNQTEPVIGGSVTGVATAITRTSATAAASIRASTMWEFTDTVPAPRDITAFDTNATATIELATLAVYWHSDVS
jgi:hypothetical protein